MGFNNENNDCKCRGCTDRHPGCHSTCENYKAFREKIDEKNKNARTMNINTASDEAKRAMWRAMRRQKKGQGKLDGY